MNTNKRIVLFFSFLIILGLGVSYYMPKEKKIVNTGLRIGSGDDITGLLLEKIIETSKSMNIENLNAAEDELSLFDFTFKDC